MRRGGEQALSVTVVRRTDEAVLLDDGENEEVWFPLSQISIEDDVGPGDECDVVVPRWLLEKRNWA